VRSGDDEKKHDLPRRELSLWSFVVVLTIRLGGVYPSLTQQSLDGRKEILEDIVSLVCTEGQGPHAGTYIHCDLKIANFSSHQRIRKVKFVVP
jgi:hypothetical protein